MKIYTAKINQTLYDIALQIYGDRSAITWLCKDNDLDLDTDLLPGTELKIRDSYRNKSIANYFQTNNITVCSS